MAANMCCGGKSSASILPSCCLQMRDFRSMPRSVTCWLGRSRAAIVHIVGSLGPGGAERQMVYTTAGLIEAPIESVQVLCYYMDATAAHQYDFYLPALKDARVPVRSIRRQFGALEFDRLPPGWRAKPTRTVERLYSLVVGGNGDGRVRRLNVLYGDASSKA